MNKTRYTQQTGSITLLAAAIALALPMTTWASDERTPEPKSERKIERKITVKVDGKEDAAVQAAVDAACLLYTSPSPRD